jgi:hypothetical protein
VGVRAGDRGVAAHVVILFRDPPCCGRALVSVAAADASPVDVEMGRSPLFTSP